MLSHYQLKHERVCYHGLGDKVYHHVDGKDMEAYTPKIDKIPTSRLADDDIRAADMLALVALSTTKKIIVLAPTKNVTMRDLHVTFGHADIRTLWQIVKTMTEFRLLGGRTLLLSKLKQQVSREPPNPRRRCRTSGPRRSRW
jgi:hypothetical protein